MMTKEIIRPIEAYQGVDIPEGCGLLTSTELLELLNAYRAGATGSIVIGMRGGSRVITIMLPAASSRDAAASQIRRVAIQLNRLACDGYIYIRRSRLLTNSRQKIEVMVIDHAGDDQYQQINALFDRHTYRVLDWNTRIGDETSTFLQTQFAD